MAHGVFLARGLAVDVDERGVAGQPERAGAQLPLHPREGIVQRVHEDPAHDIHHQHAGAVLGLQQIGAATGRACGIIQWADEARLAGDEDQRLLLVPGVIAQGHAIGAGLDDLPTDGLGDAEAPRRVFAIHHHEIELPVPAQAGQAVEEDVAPGAAHDVADEENPHGVSLSCNRSIRSR